MNMKRSDILILSSLYFFALFMRLLPVMSSTLPFNIDGFPQVKLAETIMNSGTLKIGAGTSIESYNSIMPGMPYFIAALCSVSGLNPVMYSQILFPMATSIIPVLGYILAMRITDNRTASFTASVFLCAMGFFVYLTTAIMKEALGFILLFSGMIFFMRREEIRSQMLFLFILIMLPIVHQLTYWVAITSFAYMVALDWALKFKDRQLSKERVGIDLTCILLGTFFGGFYYSFTRLGMYNELARVSELFLFFSIFFLFMLPAIYMSVYKSKARFIILFFIPAQAIILVVANIFTKLFSSTVIFPPLFIFLLIPFIILGLFSIYGWNLCMTHRSEKVLITGTFLGPLCVYNFALSLGFSQYTFDIIYRTADYLDMGIMLGIATSVAYIINKFPGNIKKSAVLMSVIILSALSYFPAPYLDEMGGLRDITTQGEFSAMEWISYNAYSNEKIGTDVRYDWILEPYFNANVSHYDIQKFTDRNVKTGEYIFMNLYWMDSGAEYVSGSRQIMGAGMYNHINNNNIKIYSNSDGVEIYRKCEVR